MILFAAFTLGLLGSLHCALMCAPIAISLPGSPQRMKFVFGRIAYNFGRLSTYIFLGFIAMLVGKGLFAIGAQRWVSIVIGAILAILALLPKSFGERSFAKPIYLFTGKVKSLFSSFIKKRTIFSMYVVGILNGFLPCGLVYMALATALAASDLVHGALFMLIFGLGTFPLMLVASLMGNLVKQSIRLKFNKAVPIFIFMMGCLLIVRGLNLGIPYVSPKVLDDTQETVVCE